MGICVFFSPQNLDLRCTIVRFVLNICFVVLVNKVNAPICFFFYNFQEQCYI
jgi:hypothetical protein